MDITPTIEEQKYYNEMISDSEVIQSMIKFKSKIRSKNIEIYPLPKWSVQLSKNKEEDCIAYTLAYKDAIYKVYITTSVDTIFIQRKSIPDTNNIIFEPMAMKALLDLILHQKLSFK